MSDIDINQICFITPCGWTPDSPNPFTSDGTYGEQWSCFRVVDSGDFAVFNGRSSTGLYNATVNVQKCPNYKHMLADFLRYETSHGRNVIISCPDGIESSALIANALDITPPPDQIRAGDPKWVVHSTSLEAWQQIEATGELRSHHLLHSDKPTLGFTLFGEPHGYADYIMFGQVDSVSSEIVVATKENGSFANENESYTPGVRLYFDAHKIITDGLAVRDGLHVVKVYMQLPLSPYLIAAITRFDVDPNGEISAWTPRMFLDAANSVFSRITTKIEC